MGEQEVYICYDKQDQLAADTVCNALEENDIKCWLKSRDGSINLDVDEIMEAIKQSKVVVLIFSEYSKLSNYVNTETDISFSEKKPILTFNVDESKLDGGLKFFINEGLVTNIFPDTESRINDLIKNTLKALDREVSQPVTSSKTKNLEDQLINEAKKRIANRKRESIFSKLKIPIIAVVVILIIGAGIFAFMNFDDGIGGTSEAQKSLPNIAMKITDFHVKDVRKQDIAWNYSYTVAGTFSPQPSNDDGYKIVVDFYDKSGDLVNSSETEFKNAQVVDKGYLFGSCVSDENNIKRADAQLINENDIVIAQAESNL